jgi:hypothetical protein
VWGWRGRTGGCDHAKLHDERHDGVDPRQSRDHGHTLSVPRADVMAGTQKMYSIEGTADHAHMVTITPAVFTMLQSNTTVTVNSATGGIDGHTHNITIMCV